jgi:hypothetical protein
MQAQPLETARHFGDSSRVDVDNLSMAQCVMFLALLGDPDVPPEDWEHRGVQMLTAPASSSIPPIQSPS